MNSTFVRGGMGVLLVFLIVLVSGCDFFLEEDDDDDVSVPEANSAMSFVCHKIGLAPSVAAGFECALNGTSPVVRLAVDDGEGEGTCTGTVISDTHVLTAGHCVEDGWEEWTAEPEDITVVAIVNGAYVERTVTEVALHSGYDDVSDDELILYDVAVLTVGTAFPDSVPRVPLVSSAPSVSTTVYVAGYGMKDPYDDDLQERTVVGSATVRAVTNDHVRIDFVGGESHPCQGDSGGALFVEESGADGALTLAIAGVVSQSAPDVAEDDICNYGDKTLYANVMNDSIRAFIAGAAGVD